MVPFPAQINEDLRYTLGSTDVLHNSYNMKEKFWIGWAAPGITTDIGFTHRKIFNFDAE